MTKFKGIAVAAVAAIIIGTPATTTTASAGSQVCGNYVLGGAFQNRSLARARANKVGGFVWDLDLSNSPNAGKGYWVVADGPFPRSQANRLKNKWRKWGAKDAYVKNMCFTGV